MKIAAARVDDETLEAIQVARGRVPIEEFRLRLDCDRCNELADQPITNIPAVYQHIADGHSEEIEVQ